MENQRLKILIIAHEFSPEQGSECAEGWNLVTRLAKFHDVTVLYASSNQFGNNNYEKAITNYQKTGSQLPGLTLVTIEQPKLTRLLARINFKFEALSPIGLPFIYFLGYKFWQKAAFSVAKRLHERNHFDIVHQLTQITFREPGYVWKLDIPFVWGPTGGTSQLPAAFRSFLSFRSAMMERLRSLSNYYQFNFTGRIIKANRKAAIIYAYSTIDASLLKKRSTGQVKLMLDAGTYNGFDMTVNGLGDSKKLRGIWCGQLSERKAPSILLQALAKDSTTREMVDFLIIGDGPLKESMHKMARSLNLENIKWIEKVSHDEIFSLLKEADFLVHTSLREATSNIIPEALSMSLPVICHDTDGMSIAINAMCGIKIPLVSPAQSINDFHAAMKRLIIDRKLLEDLKTGAKQRSAEISWDIMAETIAQDYLELKHKNEKIKLM